MHLIPDAAAAFRPRHLRTRISRKIARILHVCLRGLTPGFLQLLTVHRCSPANHICVPVERMAADIDAEHLFLHSQENPPVKVFHLRQARPHISGIHSCLRRLEQTDLPGYILSCICLRRLHQRLIHRKMRGAVRVQTIQRACLDQALHRLLIHNTDVDMINKLENISRHPIFAARPDNLLNRSLTDILDAQ